MEVLMVLIATAIACGVLGSFIVLRNQSMMADALSHSVLLGIVLAFIIVKDLDSFWLKIGAAIFGLLTVLIVEILSSKNKIKKDDALGVVFPVFFSIAVIIISKYFRNVHLDTDMVLLGNPLFTPFIRMGAYPKAFVIMMLMFFINLSFIAIFFKPLKISTFDQEFAKLQGIKQQLLFYGLMTLVSLTCVLAFESVGAILVISFFIAPSACAYLLTKRLDMMIFVSLIFGTLSCVMGYFVAINFNVSITGMCSFIMMIITFIVILFNKKGYLYRKINNRKLLKNLSYDLILIHIYRHSGDQEELGEKTIHKHLNWSDKKTKEYLNKLIKDKFIYIDQEKYWLTNLGFEHIKWLLEK